MNYAQATRNTFLMDTFYLKVNPHSYGESKEKGQEGQESFEKEVIIH